MTSEILPAQVAEGQDHLRLVGAECSSQMQVAQLQALVRDSTIVLHAFGCCILLLDSLDLLQLALPVFLVPTSTFTDVHMT